MGKVGTSMKDVALKANVSIGTVSHVINGTASISEETTARVKKAIKELHYVPNEVARNMRRKKTHIIGLLVPSFTNSYYARVASEFVECAAMAGYTVSVLSYNYSSKREKKEIANLIQNNVESIVILNGHGDEKYINDAVQSGINVVLADRRTDIEKVSYIQFDNRKVIRETIDRLCKFGYKKIGFISEPITITNLQDRFQSYKEALQQNKLDYNEEYVYISESFCLDNAKNGYVFAKKFFEKAKDDLPEVFLISSDLLASGVIRGIIENGYSVPDDFGIIGCDNLQISDFLNPRLSTINQDRKLLGQMLWTMIVARIKGKEIDNATLEQEFISRESCNI